MSNRSKYFSKMMGGRMFLCSRNISSGDKNVYVGPDAIDLHKKGLRFDVVSVEILEGGYKHAVVKYTAHPSMPSVVGTEREWPGDNIWKIVGLLSEKANWIKEYDCFTEEEIHKTGFDIEIKCPTCGMFH